MTKTKHGFNMSQSWSGIYLPTWPTVISKVAKAYDMVQFSCLCYPRHNFAPKTEPDLFLFQKNYEILSGKFSFKESKLFQKSQSLLP